MRISDWSSDVCSSDLAGNSEISDGIDAQCDPEAAGDERKCGDHVFDILDDARGNAALVQHPEKIVAEAAGPLDGRVENERLLVQVALRDRRCRGKAVPARDCRKNALAGDSVPDQSGRGACGVRVVEAGKI